MTPERWEDVRRLFGRAMELPEAEREAFVAKEAGADAELAGEVLAMLRARPEPGFLEPPLPPTPLRATLPAPFGPLPQRLGDFELIEELGRGRFGVVYRALQTSLGNRMVAVKVLTPSITITRRDVDRFEREPQFVAQLDHPNIVHIFAKGEEHGYRYFAMELIRGPSLADEVRRVREEAAAGGGIGGGPGGGGSGGHGRGGRSGSGSNGPLPSTHANTYFRAVAELVRQAADGLAHAHQKKVVHRDVKPANLMLAPDGHVVIVDFGLARDEEMGSITRTDVVAGTPHYMSPEQASGHFHHVDERTDVYSLGVVLYELLTLQRPFDGQTTLEVLRNIRERQPVRVRKINARVPRDLEVICNTAMARNVKERYASAGELRDDLQRFLDHQAIKARPPSPFLVIARLAHRRRYALASVALTLVALTTGLFVSRRQMEARRLHGLLGVVSSALAEGPLRDLPLSRLFGLRHAVGELRSDEQVLAAEPDDVVRKAEAELSALRTELLQRGRSDLERARDVGRPEGAREMDRLSGLATLLEASHLFTEDDELRALARKEIAYPTIAVQAVDEAGNPVDADVYLRDVDVFTTGVGEKHLLGPAPFGPAPVLPGYYRVVVAFRSGGFRELICNPGPALHELVLTATQRADEDGLAAGMTEFPGLDFTFSNYSGEPCFQGKTVSLEPFLLDRTEVSNREYASFVGATGRTAPSYWSLIQDMGQFLDEYGDFPVVGLSWLDAVAYAEWTGKRLPTVAEWHLASAGTEGRPFPFSSDSSADVVGNVAAADGRTDEWTDAGQWAAYLRFAAPVRSYPEARSPEGVFNLYGNVEELTESMVVTRQGSDELIPRAYDRFLLGGWWDAVARNQSMLWPAYVGIGPAYATWRTGFRCAKSLNP